MIVMYLQSVANAAHYNYDPIVYCLFIANAPPPHWRGYYLCFNLFIDRFLKATSHCRLPALCYLSSSSSG